MKTSSATATGPTASPKQPGAVAAGGTASPAPAVPFAALLARTSRNGVGAEWGDARFLMGGLGGAAARAKNSPFGAGQSVVRDGDAAGRHPFPASDDDDRLDPIHRHHAAWSGHESLLSENQQGLALPIAPRTDVSASAAPPCARASLEELLPTLVRKIAWSGDGRRGTVRLELGAGALAGSTLVVHADDGRVRVHLSAPPGTDAESWKRRLHERLAARNIRVEELEVES